MPKNPTSASAAPPEYIYGRRPIFEVLLAGKRALHKLWILEGSQGGLVEEILRLARERGVPLEWSRRDRLDRLAPGHHQGLVAQVSATQYLELEDFLGRLGPSESALLLALDEIEDPQNVGAMLRSAGFFAASGVIVPRWRSAPVGQTAARASSGAIEHVPLIRVRNLADALLTLQAAGFRAIGADVQGAPLWTLERSARTVLVVGNEGRGLRRLVRERCDVLAGIPRRGKLDSLNVASATAIFLYEYFRGMEEVSTKI